MYTAKLNFFICDNNNNAEKILAKISPMEDCQHFFKTAENINSIDFENNTDCALISFTGENISQNTNVRTIRVISSNEISEKLLAEFDEVWVMPENDLYNEKFLTAYFTKTAKIMKDAFDYRRLDICFRTSFDSIPDLVWFKDIPGAHLFVNKEFCETVQKTREQIYKRGHYYIWDIPKEEYEQGEYVCLESEDDVINARKTILFDENVKTKKGMSQFKTYKSPLIDVNGEIFGTCGIAHDISDLQNIHRELNVVLESMPFGVIMEDRNNNIISINKKLSEYFPDVKNAEGSNYNQWKEKYFSKAKPSINGGLKKNIKLGGRERTINLKEMPLLDHFGVNIGRIALFNDITAEEEYTDDVKKKAGTDFLTKLNNRHSLFNHLNSLDEAPCLTLITIDLDNFKAVNDTYGHAKGDEALIVTSRVLLQIFSDDFVSRLGGDEFLVVIDRRLDHEQLIELTDDFFALAKKAYSETQEFHCLTASLGISTSKLKSGESHDIEKLLKESDDALYHAKNSGKNKVCFYK